MFLCVIVYECLMFCIMRLNILFCPFSDEYCPDMDSRWSNMNFFPKKLTWHECCVLNDVRYLML